MIILDVGKAPFYRLNLVPKKVVDYVRFSVKQRYRYYEGNWFVHKDFLINVVQLAASCGDHTDYSSLPDDLQVEIALHIPQVKSPNEVFKMDEFVPTLTTAYAALHLLPSAPDALVKAAYKALVLIHHPDKGGSPEAFNRITEAYKKITED